MGRAGAVGKVRAGFRVSSRLARSLAAGSMGKNKGPRWPQALNAATQVARTRLLARIW